MINDWRLTSATDMAMSVEENAAVRAEAFGQSKFSDHTVTPSRYPSRGKRKKGTKLLEGAIGVSP